MLSQLAALFNNLIAREGNTAQEESEDMNHGGSFEDDSQEVDNDLQTEHHDVNDHEVDDDYASEGESEWFYSWGPWLASENVEGEEVDIKRIEEFKLPASDQGTSKLFTEFPGEVRELIYEYVLADFEDMENAYDPHKLYRRPQYFAPRKADTSILRTCQAIYDEAWYMPWTSARHTFYLTGDDRRPEKTTTIPQMTRQLAMIEKLHPDTPSRRKEIQQIQVFAQAWALEPGYALRQILQIPHLLPKTVTITLRHTDMWYWENDQPIGLDPTFVGKVRFPPSVTRVEMQFESLERRKAQIDYMTEQAVGKWYFRRSDKIHLVARPAPTITRWTGPSTWKDERWLADEDENLPGQLSYYMATVTFTPAHLVDDAAGYEKRLAAGSEFPRIDMPPWIADKNRRPEEGQMHVNQLEYLGATESMPASEVYRLQSEFIAASEAHIRNELRSQHDDDGVD